MDNDTLRNMINTCVELAILGKFSDISEDKIYKDYFISSLRKFKVSLDKVFEENKNVEN